MQIKTNVTTEVSWSSDVPVNGKFEYLDSDNDHLSIKWNMDEHRHLIIRTDERGVYLDKAVCEELIKHLVNMLPQFDD